MRIADISSSIALMDRRDLPRHEQLDRFGELWREILELGVGASCVLEQIDTSGTPLGVRAAGLSTFVSDEFANGVRALRHPHFTTALFSLWLAGKSPVLTTAAMYRANSGDGLNVAVLGQGFTVEGLASSEVHELQAMLAGAFPRYHEGYHIKEILVEAREPEVRDIIINCGARLIADYSKPDSSQTPGQENLGQTGFLLGLSRTEAYEQPTSFLSTVFIYRNPICGFTTNEKELLERALLSETDEEIAEALFISVPAVKKRWKRIYERVADALPQLLPQGDQLEIGLHEAQGRRGAEKRRRLLAYLSEHLEEIRP